MSKKETKVYGNHGNLKPPKIFQIKLTKEQLFSKKFRENFDDNYDKQGFDSGLDILFELEIGLTEGILKEFEETGFASITTNCKSIGEKSYVSQIKRIGNDYIYRQKYL